MSLSVGFVFFVFTITQFSGPKTSTRQSGGRSQSGVEVKVVVEVLSGGRSLE